MPDNWGPECTVEQINKQARESAMQKLNPLFQDRASIRLVGEPKVTMVLVDQE